MVDGARIGFCCVTQAETSTVLYNMSTYARETLWQRLPFQCHKCRLLIRPIFRLSASRRYCLEIKGKVLCDVRRPVHDVRGVYAESRLDAGKESSPAFRMLVACASRRASSLLVFSSRRPTIFICSFISTLVRQAGMIQTLSRVVPMS
jgi:hypothetical protein